MPLSEHQKPGLVVASAQPMVVPGDVPLNIERMLPLVTQAAARGAKLILFSECALTGYDLGGVALQHAITLKDPALDRVQAMAAAHDMVIVTGFYEKLDASLHNTAVAFYPDGNRVVQRKHHIIAYDKAHGIEPGPQHREIFTVGDVRFGLIICSDSGDEAMRTQLSQDGCDIVLAPTAGLGDAAKGFHIDQLQDAVTREQYFKLASSLCFSEQAIEATLHDGMGLVSCNQAGYVPELGYLQPGHSMIVDTNADLVSLLPGKVVFEHLKSDLIVGKIHARSY